MNYDGLYILTCSGSVRVRRYINWYSEMFLGHQCGYDGVRCGISRLSRLSSHSVWQGQQF